MSKVQTSLRIEEETLKEAKEILATLGMNFSEAVNVFAAMVVQEKGLPFDVKISEYPPISKEEAKEKIHRSLENITSGSGKNAKVFFDELLGQ